MHGCSVPSLHPGVFWLLGLPYDAASVRPLLHAVLFFDPIADPVPCVSPGLDPKLSHSVLLFMAEPSGPGAGVTPWGCLLTMFEMLAVLLEMHFGEPCCVSTGPLDRLGIIADNLVLEYQSLAPNLAKP